MKRKFLSVLLILVLACSFSLVTAVPVAAQDGVPDRETAITRTADRLVALQGTDFGWDWKVTDLIVHSDQPSSSNLYGVTALGLIDAYEVTEVQSYLDAAKRLADMMRDFGTDYESFKAYGDRGLGYSFDLRFLMSYAEVTEDTTYSDFAKGYWAWVKARELTPPAVNVYADGYQEQFYQFYTQFSHGFAAWGTGDFGLAALAMEDTVWASAMADVLAGHLGEIIETDECRFIGWGKALEFLNAVDPEAYATEIDTLITNLTESQNDDGSWGSGENPEGYAQDIAYAIIGLAAVGDEGGAARRGADWLVSEQGYDTIIGGWNNSTNNIEYSETDSEALQALAATPAPVTIDTEGYYSIQSAINSASPEATINVAAGTYAECLSVNKGVSIVGAGVLQVTINVSGLADNSAGIYVSADNVLLQGFTLVCSPTASIPRYGIKFGDVSGGSVMEILVRDINCSGFDFLGTRDTTISNVESRNNGGHGISLVDCNNITLSDITTSGSGWQAVSVATWGRHTPLGTSGIVFTGTNSFGKVFQLEEGDYNNPDVAPSSEAIITYSTNIADGADVTVQASDFGYALHGDQDDGPCQNRVWFFKTLAEAQTVISLAPVSHLLASGIYVESLTDRTQLYISPGCEIQDAINAATAGDTVNVAAGTYLRKIVINKALTVKSTDGAEDTIIQGVSTSDYYLVDIQHSDVTFDGFTVTNPTTAFGSDVSGILVQSRGELVSNVHILNNIVTQVRSETETPSMFGATGINIGKGPLSDIVISGNTIMDIKNPDGAEVDHTCGINVWDGAEGVVISGNTISDIKYNGIILEYASNVQIENNTITECETGIRVEPYEGVTVSDLTVNLNNISGNTWGVKVINIANNVDATYNWWGHASGPSHELSNGKWVGKGDKVSDNVDYKPWLHKSREEVVPSKKPAYAQQVVLDNTGEYGWNTFSTPIFLDDEADTWKELYDLTDLEYSVAYRFDSDNQTFVLLTTADDYAIEPGEGFFIKMADVGSLTILYSTEEKLIPPSRPLTAGWNLIGLANLEDMDVDDAFPSIATVAGLAGYSQVVSPIGNAEPGPVLADGTIYVGESYWVYMLGARTLAGFTLTPVKWVP